MKQIDKSIKYLIVLAILVNAVGLFFPALRGTFTPYYGSIAKHIITSGNWSDLMLLNQDWLDKPHLPFWLTAISYQIFGINSFAYILPGFLFHLVGLYFTYKISRIWYSHEVGLLAVLFTASALHLMLSSIDVRAEAFMLGEIMPACYFWLRYDKHSNIKYLLGGAFFTALAIMTKGLFVLITIISGLAVLWICSGKWRNFISFKWIFALCLSCVLIFPELWALYVQFDLHPEKIVYGYANISGIRWFLWDGIVGRLLGTGPIRNDHADFSHYFFFMHTFLWAYLPWWPIFITATWQFIKNIKYKLNKEPEIFLFSSFFITFILFSISTFQVDHYTNIIFPFASIICAAWLSGAFVKCKDNCHILFYAEVVIALVLLFAVLVITQWALSGFAMLVVLILDLIAWMALIYFKNKNWQFKIIVFPTIAMSVVFVLLMTINGIEYAKYDGGYQIANYLNMKRNNITVISYNIKSENQMDMLGLNFHGNNSYIPINGLDQLRNIPNLPVSLHIEDKNVAHISKQAIYLVIEDEDLDTVKKALPMAKVEKEFKACDIETFIANVLDPAKLNKSLHTYVLLKVSS